MNERQLLQRIELNPGVMAGKPTVKGTRLTVEFILNLLAHSATEEEILLEYNGLTGDDLRACLLFGAKSLEHTDFVPPSVEMT